ncbi:MAG TPA: hypothetical protein EYO61_03730 [Campylobacterales bacterium]|nr:hypothetical protein [Campylobacterales bacterium]
MTLRYFIRDYGWRIKFNRKKDELLEPINMYELFKMAFTTHYIDAALVRTVVRIMKKGYGVQMSSNHDNYLVHPEYMFQTVDAYINAFKLLMINSDKKLNDILIRWGAVDTAAGYLERHTNRLTKEEVLAIPNVNMINMVFSLKDTAPIE